MTSRLRWLSLTAVGLTAGLTLIPASRLSRLEVDTSNQSMSSSPVGESTDPFTNRPTLLIAVSGDRPFTINQWQALNTLSTAVGEIPGVDRAILPFIQANGWTMQLFKKIHPAGATRLQNLLRLLRSEDGKALGILVMLSPEAGTGPQRTQTLADLRAVREDHPIVGLNTCLVGLPVVNEEVGELIRRDQGLLLPLSAGVILLMLLLVYRNPVGVLLPMGVIGLAVTWTLGIYAWRVQQLNVVTSLLAPVVMILSLATAVHVYEAFLGCRHQSRTATEAVNTALQRMLARHYYQKRIILCGDAAHAMSPVGGQGMNTGFADAALLTETLEQISRDERSGDTLLRYYERNRKQAYRVATCRAARNMWIGTRRGSVWSRLRSLLLHTLLQQSQTLRLAEHFAMLTIPNQPLISLAMK